MIEATYMKALTEVYDIINHLEKEIYEKIPNSFISIVEENMDKNYKVNIDYDAGINNQELLPDTRAILSLIYRKFVCNEDERIELERNDKENFTPQKNENVLKIENVTQYISIEDRLDDLAKSNNVKTADENVKEETALAEQNKKDKWYKKLRNLFQRIFNIK